MSNTSYEAIVIGAGPGGYPCGIRLAQLGVKTLVVEKESFGGVCLNWGCIPSKALIAATGLLDKIKRAETMGIAVSDLTLDVGRMQDWKDGIVKKLTSGVRSLLKGNGADTVLGEAKLVGKNKVEVREANGEVKVYEATKGIVIATGARVVQLPNLPYDGEVVISAREAVSLREAPKRMLVVGGGVIGLELGMVYMKLGTEVTIVELTPDLLPGVDRDLVRVVEKHLKKGGARVLTETKASNVEIGGGVAKVTLEGKGGSETLEFDKVLVSVGFKPNTDGLGLTEVGVKLDERGHVKVNERLETSVKGIYAIGDVSGAPYLAHKATHEGEICAEVIAGHNAAIDYRAMPAAIFTEPEIATVGMTETQAERDGRKVKIGKFPFAASGRALAVDSTDGFVKTIVDAEDHQVLGVAIVGPEASDLISEASLAIEMGAFAEDVTLTIHPHPTLGETVMESFKHAIGEAVHVMNKK
ncbi:MAG: dihydrolipoyl dehydrogenase [Myxococcales bacterium]|nr:dihydrolipoyl dehydrogenase [Myxococcales bacterium]